MQIQGTTKFSAAEFLRGRGLGPVIISVFIRWTGLKVHISHVRYLYATCFRFKLMVILHDVCPVVCVGWAAVAPQHGSIDLTWSTSHAARGPNVFSTALSDHTRLWYIFWVKTGKVHMKSVTMVTRDVQHVVVWCFQSFTQPVDHEQHCPNNYILLARIPPNVGHSPCNSDITCSNPFPKVVYFLTRVDTLLMSRLCIGQ